MVFRSSLLATSVAVISAGYSLQATAQPVQMDELVVSAPVLSRRLPMHRRASV